MPAKIANTALTIAGSDSSGGAGIQADIKTFAAHEVFGASVITSVTSQNFLGVRAVYDLPVNVVEEQLLAAFSDRKPNAVKTGMLGNESIVECVSLHIKRNKVKNLIVDPVILSSSGRPLLSKKGIDALKDTLLPLALLVTPNLYEAGVLSGVTISRPSDRIKAARALMKTGAKNVLIKGGHAKGRPEDYFYDGKNEHLFTAERVTDKDMHGTGCVLSSAIAAGLAKGNDLLSSISQAKLFIGQAIIGGVQGGMGVTDPLSQMHHSCEQWDLFQRVSVAIDVLKENGIGELIPEVQSNIAVAMRNAKGHEDVIAFPGRIVKHGKNIVTLAPPSFGGSKHVANIVLTVLRFDPSQRAVMNIKYNEDILKICQRLKFKMASFSRSDEPKRVKEKEGSSLEWGTEKAILDCGFVPDIIYDKGGMGKEEMIRVIASDVETLVEKVLRIHRLHSAL
jgi:hydroxymethylpyrimidine/phosphomethylpyrimidine kinase